MKMLEQREEKKTARIKLSKKSSKSSDMSSFGKCGGGGTERNKEEERWKDGNDFPIQYVFSISSFSLPFPLDDGFCRCSHKDSNAETRKAVV